MTGTGRYNTELDCFVMDIKTTGRWACNVQSIRRGEKVNITGTCNGKPIQADRADTDQDRHQMPNLDSPN
jgi:hypothetical protein